MKNLAWIPASVAVAGLLYVAACSSKSNGDGTAGTGGGGTISGAGACVIYLDDAGNTTGSGVAAGCIVTAVNGSNTSGPPCASGLTYANSCPTQGLVGCCTNRANSDATTVVLVASCVYSDTGETAAQAQTVCETPFEDGGAPGTWSTSPPQ